MKNHLDSRFILKEGAITSTPKPSPPLFSPLPADPSGFSSEFWAAYHELIPRAPGFDERAEIYRLYHYLNHLNLFGDGYYSQCASILKRLT